MTDQFSPIRPKQVPLSHAAAAPPPATASRTNAVTWALALLLAGGLLVLVFVFVPTWLEHAGPPAVAVPENAADGSPDPAPEATPASGRAAEDPRLPPFQQLQREQARKQAQEQLASFVELQIELEENMQVGAWGQDDYDAAKALAAAGDEQFVREQFEPAIASYQAATETLDELIGKGRELLESSLQTGNTALAARNGDEAAAAFDLATTIAPDDPRVVAGQARVALLPQISSLMRRGRNHELNEEWAEAAATYDEIQSLDPATSGLETALDRVAAGRQQTRIRQRLSEGFAHLDDGRFEQARGAFNEVLRLAPGNAVAAGGLEQVSKRADIVRIERLRDRADQAAAAERWEEAATLYEEVLAFDGTIQFAQAGQAGARAQLRARTALERIIESPERLSSDKLYREAREILARAEDLEPRGPALAQRIDDVSSILTTYAEPVAVLLRSDNRTEVTVSTVGVLGSFEEKRLQLRPGAYTVIGSRDGCRDVREQIVVRPNMNPVDIRCVESL